jgi:hypothetical protein
LLLPEQFQCSDGLNRGHANPLHQSLDRTPLAIRRLKHLPLTFHRTQLAPLEEAAPDSFPFEYQHRLRLPRLTVLSPHAAQLEPQGLDMDEPVLDSLIGHGFGKLLSHVQYQLALGLERLAAIANRRVHAPPSHFSIVGNFTPGASASRQANAWLPRLRSWSF